LEISTITNWWSLCALVLLLGMKHGFDADHLATIDGLTRFNIHRNPSLARICGTLFSLGHGAVVLVIALLASFVPLVGHVPSWLEGFGMMVSILFLVVLGVINLKAVITAKSGEMVKLVGIKGRWLARLTCTSDPRSITLIGALFALSFDTISQATMFGLIATRFGGWQSVFFLGLLFMFGMLIVDGINGLWISRLLRKADSVALIASRVMGIMVSILSLTVAAFAIARWTLPWMATWSEGQGIAFGAVVVLLIAVSFLFAILLGRRSLAKETSEVLSH